MAPSDPYAVNDESRPRRRWLMWLGIVVVIVIAVGAVVAVKLVGGYQQAVDLGQHVVGAYGELDRTHPFEPPARGRAISAARWRDMIAAREALADAMTPELNTFAETALNARSGRQLLGIVGQIDQVDAGVRAASEAHIAQLTERGMGLNEYGWMIGCVIHDSLERGTAQGNQWRAALDRIAQLSQVDDDTANDVDPADLIDKLAREYQGQAAPPSWVDQQMAGRSSTALHMSDLAAAFTN